MKRIRTVKEAIDYIERVVGIEVTDCSKFKYYLQDKQDDVDFEVRDDKELIEYANEQKEAIES